MYTLGTARPALCPLRVARTHGGAGKRWLRCNSITEECATTGSAVAQYHLRLNLTFTRPRPPAQDYYTKQVRGIAFIEYTSSRDAEAALPNLHRMYLGGKEVQAMFAQQVSRSCLLRCRPCLLRCRPCLLRCRPCLLRCWPCLLSRWAGRFCSGAGRFCSGAGRVCSGAGRVCSAGEQEPPRCAVGHTQTHAYARPRPACVNAAEKEPAPWRTCAHAC